MNFRLRQELRKTLTSLLLPVILLGACVRTVPSAESVSMPSAAGNLTRRPADGYFSLALNA